jgi:chemotaxis signal transduction protein
VNARNTPVLLVDVGALLGLPPRAGQKTADQVRHVFVERAGDIIGLLVERTRRFRALPSQPAAPDGQFVAGVVQSGEDVVRVLDLEAIWKVVVRELGAPMEQGGLA